MNTKRRRQAILALASMGALGLCPPVLAAQSWSARAGTIPRAAAAASFDATARNRATGEPAAASRATRDSLELPGARDSRQPIGLEDAVRLALARYPTVGAARADLDRAAAEVGRARARLVPSLRTDGSLTRFQEPMIVAPLHRLDFINLPEFDRTLAQGTVSLGYTLFDGGERAAQVRAARARRDVAAAGLDAERMAILEEVTSGYVRVLTLRDVLRAEDRRLEALTAEEDRARQFLEEGRAARVELLRAQAAVSRAGADRVATAGDLAVAAADLRRLTGAPPSVLDPATLAGVRLADSTAVPDRGALLDAARAGNPEVDRARRQAAAADAARSVARAAWFPRLETLGEYVERGSAAGDWSGEWQAALQLAYPLFTGGSRASEVAAANAVARGAREDVRTAELVVERDLDVALAAQAEQRARVGALLASVTQSEEVVRIERLALDAGRGVQTDYLRAEADLLDARAALIQAHNEEILAWVRLARAAGRLSPEWISRNVEASP